MEVVDRPRVSATGKQSKTPSHVAVVVLELSLVGEGDLAVASRQVIVELADHEPPGGQSAAALRSSPPPPPPSSSSRASSVVSVIVVAGQTPVPCTDDEVAEKEAVGGTEVICYKQQYVEPI